MAKAQQTTRIELGPEIESDRGWSYSATIHWPQANPSDHQVHMSHADYEHWCGGIEPPSLVVERALRITAAALGQSTPRRFDLAQIRRRVKHLDDAMKS